MATVTSKTLARTAAATSSTTLYTVPASTTAVVTDIQVCNSAATSATITITLDGVDLIKTAPIDANSTASFELKQVLTTTKIIAGLASAITVSFHISGVEIV